MTFIYTVRASTTIRRLFIPIRGYTMYNPTFIKLPKTSQSSRQMSMRKIRPERSQFSERGYILLTVPILTFGLGTWQIQRRKWKLNLIQEMQEKSDAEPVDFPEDYSNELNKLEYSRVKVTGTFDNSRTILMGPKSILKEDESSGGLISMAGNVGYHVITPFKVKNRDLEILVNRGWIPMQKRKKSSEWGELDGEVTFTGVVRHTEKRAQFTPKNDPARNMWHCRDLEMLSNHLGTQPVFIDADSDSSVPGGPLGGQTRVSLRNEHVSYIFTWFTLSFATSWLWYAQFGRKFMFK